MKFTTTTICLLMTGIGAAGMIVAAPQAGPDRPASATTRGSQADHDMAPAAAGIRGARSKAQPPLHFPEGYVIDPPDLIRVEVVEALPGRSISGERLVRPDGKISLGFYGDVYVAGLTLRAAKAQIVEHLSNYLTDEVLGLLERDHATGDYRRDQASQLVRKRPEETDRVLVDVVAHNSKIYYVLGDVRLPGRFSLTGNETVLDALDSAGGLLHASSAQETDIRLVRPAPPGGCCEQILPVSLAAITAGGDPTTNYQLMPRDRLIVRADRGAGSDRSIRGAAAQRGRPTESQSSRPYASTVRAEPADDGGSEGGDGSEYRSALRDLDRRLGAVERKLDRIIEALEHRGDR